MYSLLTISIFTYTSRLIILAIHNEIESKYPLTLDSPKVIFDLHFVILLQVVNSDANSIIPYPANLLQYSKISRFKGPSVSYFQHFELPFKTNERNSTFLKVSNCPDPFILQIQNFMNII